MMVIRNNVLVDIDHVISNAFWRDPMIGLASWDEYHAASVEDKPIYDMVNLMQVLHGNYQLIGFTARPAKWRHQTMQWLVRHDVPLDELLMRPDDNYRPAPEVKMELAVARFTKQLLADSIAFILDDREDVIAAFKALGITALQVYGSSR